MAMSVAAHFLIEQSHIPLLLWRAERSSFCVFLTLLIPHAVTTACVFSRMMMIYCNHVHRCRNWQLCYTSSHLFWIWNSRLCPDYQITWSFPVFLLSIFKCCFLFSFVLFKISLSSLCEVFKWSDTNWLIRFDKWNYESPDRKYLQGVIIFCIFLLKILFNY